MTDTSPPPPAKLSWRFPRLFWHANVGELFERAAFYGVFITLSVYLTREIGFTDFEAGLVSGVFSSVMYFLPTFMGALADRVGFRRALIAAFSLLTVGYFLLGLAPEMVGDDGGDGRLTLVKLTAMVALAVIMFGAAIVKPVISGTIAKCSDEHHRARAFSIFYQVVNIGAFGGKAIAGSLREHFGLQYVEFSAAIMALCALMYIVVFYRNVSLEGSSKTIAEAWRGFVTVVKNVRFMALIAIVGGFWMIQGQLYATMPKYILRQLGEGAKPEWLANINPAVVVLLVVPITHLIRNFKPVSAIGIGLFIIPFTALCIALSPVVERAAGSSVSIFGLFDMHPITLMVVLGIGLQGLAECFLSPKFLEYASKQAPKGEEGLYLGYQHLTTCYSWLFGFILSGGLLDKYCPDPKTLGEEVHAQWQVAIDTGTALPEAYAHAHYIWYVYTGIGVFAFLALIVFNVITRRIDARLERQRMSPSV